MNLQEINWLHVFRVKRQQLRLTIIKADKHRIIYNCSNTEECDRLCESMIELAKQQKICLTIEGYGDLKYDG